MKGVIFAVLVVLGWPLSAAAEPVAGTWSGRMVITDEHRANCGFDGIPVRLTIQNNRFALEAIDPLNTPRRFEGAIGNDGKVDAWGFWPSRNNWSGQLNRERAQLGGRFTGSRFVGELYTSGPLCAVEIYALAGARHAALPEAALIAAARGEAELPTQTAVAPGTTFPGAPPPGRMRPRPGAPPPGFAPFPPPPPPGFAPPPRPGYAPAPRPVTSAAPPATNSSPPSSASASRPMTTTAPSTTPYAPAPAGPSPSTSEPSTSAVHASVPATDIDFGRYSALVIGNDHYRHIASLHTAVGDAEAVAKVLRAEYGYRVKTLLNADRGAILDAFDELTDTLTAGDNLLIYYAGHGWLDEDADQGYWLPVDAEPNRRSNWISNATIADTLKRLKAKHVIVVADSCYSGTLTRSPKMGSAGSDYFERMAAKRARVALTSGGLEPVSDGSSHSPFARAFIDALEANTAIMDGTTLFASLRREVMLDARQTPEYSDVRFVGHEGGDFLFVRQP